MTENRNSGPSVRVVPEGDTRPRLVCPDCGYIAYENPKIVVGSVCFWDARILLCRRAIEPRLGYWTIPAGFLETGEGMAEGAAREAWEEALARIVTEDLIGLYEIPRISQVHVFFRARLTDPKIAAGEESQEVGLFEWEDIPWGELAFPSVTWALERVREGGAPCIVQAPDRRPRDATSGGGL